MPGILFSWSQSTPPKRADQTRARRKSAANMSQQLRHLDVKAAIKIVPEELKHFLEEIDAPKS